MAPVIASPFNTVTIVRPRPRASEILGVRAIRLAASGEPGLPSENVAARRRSSSRHCPAHQLSQFSGIQRAVVEHHFVEDHV